jgi:prepilin-type N-terminal cleavage/methylation domain-containing protein
MFVRRSHQGVTLVELMLSISIIAVIFTAIVPIFTGIRASWDIKEANAEMVQNGRVLMDHMYHTLAQAQGVTRVSDPMDEDGYIEFMDSHGNARRYQIGAHHYVEYGTPGAMSALAGPVSQLQFDYNPMIRLVNVEAVIDSSDDRAYARIWTTSVHIRRD